MEKMFFFFFKDRNKDFLYMYHMKRILFLKDLKKLHQIQKINFGQAKFFNKALDFFHMAEKSFSSALLINFKCPKQNSLLDLYLVQFF